MVTLDSGLLFWATLYIRCISDHASRLQTN